MESLRSCELSIGRAVQRGAPYSFWQGSETIFGLRAVGSFFPSQPRQRLAGQSGRVTVGWTPISLHDLTERAKAQAWAEQTLTRRIQNATSMWQLGFWSRQQAARYADPSLAAVRAVLAAPPKLP